MIQGLRFVRLEVRDLARSRAFYRRGLRFSDAGTEQFVASDGRHESGPSVAHMLEAGSMRLLLVEEADDRRNGRRGVGIDLEIEVNGVDAYHDALVARGLDPSPPADGPGGRRFLVEDPDGYRWWIYQSMT